MHLLIIILPPLIAERWFFINFADIKWQMAIFRELTTIIWQQFPLFITPPSFNLNEKEIEDM